MDYTLREKIKILPLVLWVKWLFPHLDCTHCSCGYCVWVLWVLSIKQDFLSLGFRHVYREHNMSADRLSKEALDMKAGLLSFSKLWEGEIIEEGLIQLF